MTYAGWRTGDQVVPSAEWRSTIPLAEHDSVGGAASFLKWRSPPGLHIEFRRAPACISIPAMGLHTPDGLSN
ncbi:MAG TPA: hypothetical protein VFD73_15925 [Gemmatimonadales bacterium]|nr:hypothetical protein [Gemmatimonadales bacterium]